VGNRLREEGCTLSEREVSGTAELHGTLLRSYLAPMAKTSEEFEFYHESDLMLNATRQFSSRILTDPGKFLEISQNLAKHLYSVSSHPSIAEGEFIAILFQDVRLAEQSQHALGLYKIEQRETFLEVENSGHSLNLVELSGIPVSSIQKGVLIVGGDLGIFVKESSGQQTKYWADQFLKVRPRQTQKSTARLAAEFVKQVCSRINVEAGISLRRDLAEVFSANETLNYRDIEEVSEQYLDKGDVSRLTEQLKNQSGFSSLRASTVDIALLSKQAKGVLRQFPLGEGVGLTIANPRARVDKCSVSKTRSGYRAIIDIELGE
jgi:hypothetical protein